MQTELVLALHTLCELCSDSTASSVTGTHSTQHTLACNAQLAALYCVMICCEQVDLLDEAVKRMHATLTERVASGKSPLSPQDIDHGNIVITYTL
jgi:hypothetical protein